MKVTDQRQEPINGYVILDGADIDRYKENTDNIVIGMSFAHFNKAAKKKIYYGEDQYERGNLIALPIASQLSSQYCSLREYKKLRWCQTNPNHSPNSHYVKT